MDRLKFRCRFCGYDSSLVSKYLRHLIHHRHLTSSFPCGIPQCRSVLGSQLSFRSHVIRCHSVYIRKPSPICLSMTSNPEAKFVCNVQYCRKEADSLRILMKHLISHIVAGLKVQCPFPGCVKTYGNPNSLKGHVSRSHRVVRAQEHSRCEVVEDVRDSVNFVEINQPPEPVHYPIENLEREFVQVNSVEDEKLHVMSLAHFFMKLEFERLVPTRTVQYIAQEVTSLNENNLDLVSRKIQKQLGKEGVASDVVEKIVNTVVSSMKKMYKCLRSDYTRKQYYKENNVYVEPLKVGLKNRKFFYYISILQTLGALFKDKSLNFELVRPQVSAPHLLKDFTDGEVFKSNKFFQENPTAIRLVIYVDAFQLVCPIGPAKSKHKIMGIYLSVGNLPDYLRSHVDCIYLVALCAEKDFNHNIVFGKIVKDLKILESVGIEIPGVGFVKAGLVFVAGDNLGSHQLGGFLENFSRATYFCRYCTVDRPSFRLNGGHHMEFPLRNPDMHTLCVLGHNRRTRKGVKLDSKFNELSYFHVAMPGLPPCLAHDLFEGVAAHDMALFIKYFISNEWFTCKNLNDKIKCFPYTSQDCRDKPIEFKEDFERVRGGACQVWKFVNLFPLMVSNYVKDRNDDVWRSVLLLVEIIEIVCAPVIDVKYLCYLENLIFEYLDLRRDCFPDALLRPKHHYLSHYPYLISMYGPLSKVWTLRFESKHQFFKRCIRSSKNFINVLLSLSVRHELFQSFLRAGAELRCKVTPSKCSPFNIDIYSTGIQAALQCSDLPPEVLECNSIQIKGTTYCKGNIVVIRQSDYQYEIVMGKIVLILYDGDELVYFLLEVMDTDFVPHLRAYRLGARKHYEFLKLSSLLSHYPLAIYRVNGFNYVKLKHGLVA